MNPWIARSFPHASQALCAMFTHDAHGVRMGCLRAIFNSVSSPHNADPAIIEYSGLPGISKECQDAVLRLLQYGDQIPSVRILSAGRNHALLLSVNTGDLVAVKSGFGSGYRGEGSHAFSYVLQILEAHGADIEEYEVAPDFIDRLDRSCLTEADLAHLETAKPLRPRRWQDYIFHEDEDRFLWRNFPPVIPFAVLDSRLTDLALSFWDDPDQCLVTAYRRLEDILRQRTGLEEHGTKLFSTAFLGDDAKLSWKGTGKTEQIGRANLFIGAFMAHRNRRAHRELRENSGDQLREFLLLNHLFALEEEAQARE